MSRCTGGFIRATQTATGRWWNVEISPDGGLAGHDLAGRGWRYDRAAAHYVNTATGATCLRPDYRAMCGS